MLCNERSAITSSQKFITLVVQFPSKITSDFITPFKCNSKICPLAKSCKREQPSEIHEQLCAAGSPLRPTEYTVAFPESPPIFKLHCVEKFAHQFKKLKGLQSKLYYKSHLCDSFLKKQTHRMVNPQWKPQQATGWCLFLNRKMENGEDKMRKAISENNKTVLVVSFKHIPKVTSNFTSIPKV